MNSSSHWRGEEVGKSTFSSDLVIDYDLESWYVFLAVWRKGDGGSFLIHWSLTAPPRGGSKGERLLTEWVVAEKRYSFGDQLRHRVYASRGQEVGHAGESARSRSAGWWDCKRESLCGVSCRKTSGNWRNRMYHPLQWCCWKRSHSRGAATEATKEPRKTWLEVLADLQESEIWLGWPQPSGDFLISLPSTFQGLQLWSGWKHSYWEHKKEKKSQT